MPSSSRHPVVDFVPDEGCSVRGLRIGFPESFFFERLDADVELCVRGAIARAESLGAAVKPVKVPDMAAMNAAARIILLCEASAMLEPHLADRRQFGPDVLALLDQGRLLPATDYIHAQRLRQRMQREFAAGLVQCGLRHYAHHPQYRAADRRKHRQTGRPRGGRAAGHHAPGAEHEPAGFAGSLHTRAG